jgi:hypothetical protein
MCMSLVLPASLQAAADRAKKQPAYPAPKRYTLDERLAEIRPAALARLRERFKSAGVSWPPADVTLLALKDENALELHARNRAAPWRLVHRYRVQAASGGPGPKLREGDRQVPEGIYRVIFLNANSRYHVSLRLDYPNAFDRRMGAADGRTALGGDIMIHGKAASIGCLAMGDPAAEELFVLAASVSLLRITAIVAPTDFRYPGTVALPAEAPVWLPRLYADVAREMAAFRGNMDPLVPSASHWQRCDAPRPKDLAADTTNVQDRRGSAVYAGVPDFSGYGRYCRPVLGL